MSPTQPIAAWLFLPSNLMISTENPPKNPSMGPVVSFHWTAEVQYTTYQLSYSLLMQLQVSL
jgi:hypothetical protein